MRTTFQLEKKMETYMGPSNLLQQTLPIQKK